MFKQKRMRRAGHMARTGQQLNAYNVMLKDLKERDHALDLGADGKVMKWILKMMWTGFIWFRIGKVAGCCEHGDERWGCIKCWEFY
jgi:hypothetical protein